MKSLRITALYLFVGWIYVRWIHRWTWVSPLHGLEQKRVSPSLPLTSYPWWSGELHWMRAVCSRVGFRFAWTELCQGSSWAQPAMRMQSVWRHCLVSGVSRGQNCILGFHKWLWVCVYLPMTQPLPSPQAVWSWGQTTFMILCLLPSPPHTHSVCSGPYITSCLWPHLSSADLSILAAKGTHFPKCCGGSEGIIDFDRCHLCSKVSLENALNVWKAWWVPSDLENFYMSYLWETVLCSHQDDKELEQSPSDPASGTALSLFER